MHLLQEFPEFRFRKGSVFSWEPSTRAITYDPYRIDSPSGQLALLHEIGHALLCHYQGSTAAHAVEMERSAWAVARSLANGLAMPVDEHYIEQSLAS